MHLVSILSLLAFMYKMIAITNQMQSEMINLLIQMLILSKILLNIMQNQKKVYQSPSLIYDQQGFVKSFDLNNFNKDQLEEFYHTYGFLIFRNIISDKEAQKTIDSIWQATTQYTRYCTGKQIIRDDQSTWGYIRGFHKAFGFVNDGVLEQIQFWKNRQNQNVYKAFKKAYQANTKKQLTQPLIACLDRGSMMLPGGINQQWITQSLYHFDIDPWSWVGLTGRKYKKYRYDPQTNFHMLGQGNYEQNVGYTKLAGVLALSDTNQNSGGFECACGFQNYIKQWCQDNKYQTHITQDKNLTENFKKIFMRKGSLLIFSRQLPHNVYQNVSKNFRYAQYLRMAPLSALVLDEQLIKRRQQLIRMMLPSQLDVSDPISQQIFMLDGASKQPKKNNQKQNQKQVQKAIPQQQQINNKKRCSIF